ncbi:MAG: lipid-A-disaccharide synthase, partial [Opitutaceae bacterium]|nr:lipid-A-disaccharide synthase [Verrucomicrobiales bacterium]
MAQKISGDSQTTHRRRFMIIAGEPSGDGLAAELVRSLREESGEQSLEFFGAGGNRMAEAGVEVCVDMTAHSVIGLVEAIPGYWKFRSILNQLVRRAFLRRPD